MVGCAAVVAAGTIIATILSCDADAANASAQQIDQALTAKGGQFVLHHYFDCQKGQGYEVVAQGEPEGIRLGVKMLRFSDACFTELIHDALGRAMIRAPELVLPYVNTGPLLQAQDICMPFVSDGDAPDTAKATGSCGPQKHLKRSGQKS